MTFNITAGERVNKWVIYKNPQFQVWHVHAPARRPFINVPGRSFGGYFPTFAEAVQHMVDSDPRRGMLVPEPDAVPPF